MQTFNLTATGHNLNYLPQYIAQRHGYFQEQGLELVTNIPAPWDGVLDALASGKADMALGGIWVPSMYLERVENYTVFAQIANRCPLALLKHGPADGFDLHDVAGKTVLMKSGGGASVGLFFKMLLRENNIDARAVDYIQDLDGVMLGNLFQGGMGDFFVTDNLSARAMVEKNPNISVAMEMVTQGDVPWSVYYREAATVTPEVLDKQKRFCQALAKGIDFVNKTDPETYQDELAQLFPNVPVEAAIAVTNQFRSNGMWTAPVIPPEGYDRWQLGLRDARLVRNPIPYTTLVNSGPALNAEAYESAVPSRASHVAGVAHPTAVEAPAVSSAA
ncbi:hypothetical protein SPBR_01891 [Sporothrix brasiliensis 5110]|uniref:4-amino-5-hydroxymethyl-2-methylpyrimidine phosphate synthase n=1 Tax=Sporothrix brasiliensis 5110 TaxID=1398154 RepID=A0A0C2FLL7_9PEZI|nr:uncharacterized protein SPBR_01891 [Sporothrix brasiliensis 5110]KIH91983.1 hypothetical protein SPBR_01891 [Sporothrix brasiliensis 5110]